MNYNQNTPSNVERTHFARAALKAHVQSSGGQYAESTEEITDLIADLLHLKDIIPGEPESAEDLLGRAAMHYETEKANP